LAATTIDVGRDRAKCVLGGLVVSSNDQIGWIACLYPRCKFILLIGQFVVNWAFADELRVPGLAVEPVPEGWTEVQTVVPRPLWHEGSALGGGCRVEAEPVAEARGKPDDAPSRYSYFEDLTVRRARESHAQGPVCWAATLWS
jgi:hypothetical protein